MKTALVTGANKGLGLESARQLAKKGFKVYLGIRNEENGINTQKFLKSEGLDVEYIKLDVNKNSDIRSAIEIIKTKAKSIDVLVNNAGVFLESMSNKTDVSSIMKVDPVIILKTIETNTMGPLKIIQSIVPLMKENGGRIINISSGMGALTGMDGHWPGYRMSKTALNALTRICASELNEFGITVNSICPGWCRTDMGGKDASRSIEEGVESTIWLATCDNPPTGKFIRDKQEIPW